MLNLSFYSIWCRTVEVNNTDAEGRLVLGDGVRPVFMQNIFILVVDHGSITNRHSETMEDRAWEIMMLLVNNLHQKRITESQDGRNFGSARAICNLHSLQLCTRVTGEMYPFSANQTRVILSCILLIAFHDCRVIVVCRGFVHFSVTKLLLFCSQVAYAKKDLHADVVLDMATLTGAQGIATGRYHASLLTNKEVWEPACAAAGRASGDLVVSS